MNLRYQASLKNDPDLMITVSLTNVLIFKVNRKINFAWDQILPFDFLQDPKITQWTNTTLCGVPGYAIYGSKTPILSNCALSSFSSYMNSIASYLPFSFDHAVAVIPPE